MWGVVSVVAENGATNESVEEKEADATPMAVVEEEKGAAVDDKEKAAAEGEKDEAVTDGEKDKEEEAVAPEDGEKDEEGRALRAKAVAVIDAWRAGLQVKSKVRLVDGPCIAVDDPRRVHTREDVTLPSFH